MYELHKATLILADDHPLFIKGLIAVLQNDFSIIGTAADGVQLLELLQTQLPDLILIDLQMPHMDGLSAARQIATDYPKIKLIILSGFCDDELMTSIKQAGVKGYLTKDFDSRFLIEQIKHVLAGGNAFDESNEELHFNKSFSDCCDIAQYKLSTRELEIVSLIRQGSTSCEIAEVLFISVNTVEVHRKHIFKKLNLKNIQGLVEFACKYHI